MEPRPVTTIKISFENWLNTPIKYGNDIFLKDLLLDISQKNYQWILNQDDIAPNTDFDQFHNDFLQMMYNQYF